MQSKGRARIAGADYIVLLPKATAARLVSKFNEYNQIDKKLKTILIGKTCDRQLSEEGIEKEREEVWDPMITVERALLNNISSVALLNRYVSRFANANVLYDRQDLAPGKIVAIVHLPPQTKIHHAIRSDPFDDIKLAKQNAAFKACKELHEIGELDSNLMPKYC